MASGQIGSVFCGIPFLRRAGLLAVLVLSASLQGATTAAANDVPALYNFEATLITGDFWMFSGFVDDEYPEYCTILFGDNLDGYVSDVNSDGTFYAVYELYPQQYGLITARAQDDYGQLSNTEAVWVY